MRCDCGYDFTSGKNETIVPVAHGAGTEISSNNVGRCPQCRAEYREGFAYCSDCGVPLIAEAPPLWERPSKAAVLRSFVASCQRFRINPFAWLKDVLSRIAAHPINRLTELLPHNWASAQAN